MPALCLTDGELKWNNYQSRYHDLHADLMDVLYGFGASPSLANLAKCALRMLANSIPHWN